MEYIESQVGKNEITKLQSHITLEIHPLRKLLNNPYLYIT